MAGLLIPFIACEDSHDSLQDEGVGRLSVEVQKDKEPLMSVTKVSDTDVDQFLIKGIPDFTGTYEELKKKGTLELKTGPYTISAQSPGTMQVASIAPFYYGEEEKTILAGSVSIVNIRCTMTSTKVKLDVSGILGFFKENKLTVTIRQGDSTESSKSHAFNIEADGTTDDWYFDPTKSDYKVVITGTTLDDLAMNNVYPLADLVANTYLTVTIKGPDTKSSILRSSDFNIKVTTIE